MPKANCPTELSEQIAVVRALRRSGIRFAAVPNGGLRTKTEAIMLRNSGVQAGVPDILIFDMPADTVVAQRTVSDQYKDTERKGPIYYFPIGKTIRALCGCALEMKRANGKPSDVSPEQKVWLQQLADRGWLTVVGYGATDALTKLEQLGYRIQGGLA